MKALVKMAPLVLLLFSATVIVSAENMTTNVPYFIPDGYVNDIRISYFEDEPFEPVQVQEFPVYYYNYTAEAVGWIEVSIVNQTGARPVVQVNGESVYSQMDTFYWEQVGPGDFIKVQMIPPRVLEAAMNQSRMTV